MSLILLLVAAGLFVTSGVFRGLLGPLLAALAALAGLVGVASGFGAVPAPSLSWAWAVPGARFSVALDSLGAAFLLPALVIPALGAVYGHAYFPPAHATSRRTRLAFGILPASLVLVILSRDAFLFLVAWEVMALSAFFLLNADDHDSSVRESAWVYLAATHLGTLCLIAAFAILARHTGDLALTPVNGLPSADLGWASLLFLAGFGMKAGIMPLHFWLPGAHANAPSHVSAVMSGVVLNMGLYGLTRMASLLGEIPGTWGGVLLALGASSAVLGAALAVLQDDLKRMLAYSSVDNMAIALVGLGLALIGRASGRDDLLVLGAAGAVWHMWNHSLFKTLLFLGAGAVVHATGTRRMDLMGGLARSMPVTAATTFVGALALAGLPPLNGFFGELILYVGLARSATGPGWPALAMPALALTGALAVVAMVKLYGGVFLGSARRPMDPHEAHPAMLMPMGLLAGACAGAALGAAAIGPVLDEVVAGFALRREPSLADMVPLPTLTILISSAAAVTLSALAWIHQRRAGALTGRVGTWDCGYAQPTPRIQYTPSSFSQTVLGLLDRAAGAVELKPRLRRVFPARSTYVVSVPDPVLDRAALPGLRAAAHSAMWVRLTQQGNVQLYVLYILLALGGLLWLG